MSVVNKMLQDLEARKTAPETLSADYLPPPKNYSKIWFVLIILLVLAAATFLWFIGPRWTQAGQHSANSVDNKLQTKQSTEQSKQVEIEAKALNGRTEEAVSGGLALAPTNSDETSQAQTSSANKSLENRSDAPLSSTYSQTNLPSAPKVYTVQEVRQYPHPTEKVVDNRYTKNPSSESRFSINDSSEKNKAAGAKQGVVSALSDGDNQLAIRRLEDLLRVHPSNVEARKKLAALLFAEKRSNQAEHVLQQGIVNHPQRSDLRLMMARLYMQKKDNEAAIQLLNEVQPDAVNKLEFLAYRAALLQQNAHNEQAKNDYLQLVEADGGNAKWWLGLAITQDRLGQNTAALSAYRNAYNKEQLSPSVVKFVEQRMTQIEGAQ